MTSSPRLRRLLPALTLLAACGSDRIVVPRAPDFAVLPSLLTLAPGDTARLRPQLEQRPTRAGVLFLSRGTVATVTGAGLVTALTPGEGAVTAVAPDAGIIYTVPITVRGVRLRVAGRDSAVATLTPGSAAPLEATVFGIAPGADSTVRWTTSDSAVATIGADGTLQARAAGRAVIAATSAANPFLRATTVVEVSAAGEGRSTRRNRTG